jgi:hypothetical protein
MPEEEYLVEVPLSATSPGCPKGAMEHRHPEPKFRFGRLFPELVSKLPAQEPRVVDELVQLATLIGGRADGEQFDSSIPSGYTYLGQFIAHEITFDKTEEPLDSTAGDREFRSPQIDLDSLYGRGPAEQRHFYQDSARLKVGETIATLDVPRSFLNDLPRSGYGDEHEGRALVPDPRNDENLAVAQTHVAFSRFHNRIVDMCGGEFEAAKKDVVQHFQAIILTDFLPTLVDKKSLDCVLSGHRKYFKPDPEFGPCMPLEFSVAAFRIGHSMVRNQYQWNEIHNSTRESLVARIEDLFRFTAFSGNLGGKSRLVSDWIIDWRRFFDLTKVGFPERSLSNKARKVDTNFSLQIEKIHGYPHLTKNPAHQSIAARNLLRGYAVGLPSGEQVADLIGVDRLKPEEVGIESELLKGNTPLWYYCLKEAELNDGKLGPVSSCIIAETLVGLIKESPNSILNEKDWMPKEAYARRFKRPHSAEDRRRYLMADLLQFADVVDPVGQFFGAN